jgi:protein CpxP
MPPMSEPANKIEGAAAIPDMKSFTEAQARSRLELDGYRKVSGLTKDNAGNWNGTATKDGAQVRVSVDTHGTISVN